ncbi:hypothetical protein [Streptomyces candidus]|uniref:Uncharacterized protein n=1 Tax=Streptomyces candidus TaxID=67283 RepID=A0A7X0HMI1_9ACTN|nr:hypothetical protein [Streptomyces candidus]MBB6439114.1 hypothetical protein [Streptomyces candidus]
MRAALVLLLALLAGAGAGALCLLADKTLAESILIGAGAAGLAVTFFDRLIAAESTPGHATPPNNQSPADGAGADNA